MISRCQLPNGIVAEYQLGINANDISGNNNNGTLTSTTTITDRFGNPGGATFFSSGTSYGELPPAIASGSFSIGFWINTTMNANTGTQWYQGQSLVDAEVCGVTTDWGTALINGGEIAFGTGNPDVTIISPSSYNDGQWHYITVTRNTGGLGTNTLYVDGALVGTRIRVSTSARVAPTFIGLGRNNCTGPDYTGALDDLIFYGRALSSTEVGTLYAASAATSLPVGWISFTAAQQAGESVLLNWETGNSAETETYEVERSQDGAHFSLIGELNKNQVVELGGGQISGYFTDNDPQPGANFYRILAVGQARTASSSGIDEVNLPFAGTGTFFKILPDPVTSYLNISNPGQLQITEIRVLDMTGRTIYHIRTPESAANIQLALGGLAPGAYLLDVFTKTKIQIQKFVKE